MLSRSLLLSLSVCALALGCGDDHTIGQVSSNFDGGALDSSSVGGGGDGQLTDQFSPPSDGALPDAGDAELTADAGAVTDAGAVADTGPVTDTGPTEDAEVAADVGLFEDAAVIDADAAVIDTDAAVIDTDAAVIDTDAAVIDTDAAVVEEDAAVIEEDAAVVEEDAAVIEEDAAVVEEDAAVIEEDAAVIEEDAGCVDCDGDGMTVEEGDCDDDDPNRFLHNPEICDGLDNDCNGFTDGMYFDCYDGPDVTLGLGLCAGGRQQCVRGVILDCAEQVLPVDEICDDGVDNDCDGEVDEGCEPEICPGVARDSAVTVSAGCLTTGGVAQGVVQVALISPDGAPVVGLEVVFAASEGVSLEAGGAADGVYWRTYAAGAVPGEAQLSATVTCADGHELRLPMTPTVRMVAPPAPTDDVVTGGCDEVAGTVEFAVESSDGAPLEGAWVMVGDAPTSTRQPSAAEAMAGTPGGAPNWARTDAAGRAALIDFGGGLRGPQTVTVGAEGYENVTLVGLNASALSVPLRPVQPPAPVTATLSGAVTEYDDLSTDGDVDIGLVLSSFDLSFLASMSVSALLGRSECWDPVTTGPLAAFVPPVALPGNLDVPAQIERVGGLETTLQVHTFSLDRVPVGADHIVALGGKIAADAVAGMLLGGGGLADLLPEFTFWEIGVLPALNVVGDAQDVNLPLSTPLASNARCSASNVPPDANLVCVAAGDWSGADGTGRLFPMGIVTATPNEVDTARPGALTLPLATVAQVGAFQHIGYLAAGVAAYLDTPPVGMERAVSAVLDRTGLDAAGGDVVFDSFFSVTPLGRDGREFFWIPVENANSPAVDLCRFDVVREIQTTYDPGACSGAKLQRREVPVWTAYVGGVAEDVALPTLPEGWPRAADGGFIDLDSTPEHDVLLMRIRCMSLGLTPAFHFDHGDFGDQVDGLSHQSTNTRPF